MLLKTAILFISLKLGLLTGGLSFLTPHSAATVPPTELCQLQGSVYVTDSPERADYFVYVEDFESSADINIFMEENKLFANQSGLWFFIEQEAFADFVVYFTDSKGMADFSIYYTDVASFAGCRN